MPVFRIADPRGTAGGEQRQLPAVLGPADKLAALLDDGHIRAGGGVIDELEAHAQHGGKYLPGGDKAVGLAQRLCHTGPHRGSHLGHHDGVGIIDGRPGAVDVFVDDDGAGGTHGGTLAAAHAVGFREGHLEGGAHLHAGAAPRKVDGAHALDLVAHPDTVAAQDALGVVDADGYRGFIHLGLGLSVGEAHVLDIEPAGQLPQTAALALRTGGAVPAVVGQEQLQNILAVFPQAGRVGDHAHPRPGRRGAGGVHIAPLVLHHAHPAGAIDRELGIIAEGWHIDPRLAHELEDVLFPFDGDGDLVDEHTFFHWISPPSRRQRHSWPCTRRT